ncbi:MAG: hypothetical protein IPP15_23035 [Saprospiraceae bacterium]|uniref:Uncharacterized protein n=1 Tax=Candidatus Opimibacter skivensis TaxID=2982028 RepID=A0A9D7XQ34_9BACT|nr:hypothetical protein [Candidatus Opimibacter skivensis]
MTKAFKMGQIAQNKITVVRGNGNCTCANCTCVVCTCDTIQSGHCACGSSCNTNGHKG